ncbi:MAG TPA: tRNA (adenosine(37)-N6)-threonylcarbamoyltransferase complex ATPase subunit type 1 TsaE [Candidatus Paceibacterota bacterium]
MKFLSKSFKETQKIASGLARKIIKTKKGAVISLEGELGAGKTTFIQGFAKALGIKSKVKSPTFVLMKKYPVKLRHGASKVSNQTNLYHLDCYRIRDYKDLRIPEMKEIFESSYDIILVEWAERIKRVIPKKHITIHIDHISKNQRKITIT